MKEKMYYKQNPKSLQGSFFSRAGEQFSGQAKAPGHLPCKVGGFKY